MTMCARFDAQGRYTWVGNLGGNVVPEDHADLYMGVVDPLTQYHDAVSGEPVTMPARPSMAHVFDWASKAWADPRTIADHRAVKWAAAKAARDAAIEAPLVTAFGTFDANAASAIKITQAVLLANNMATLGQNAPINFTLADNTVAVLMPLQMVQVGFALAGREQSIRAAATAVREAINAAQTVAAVNAVSWTF